MKKIAFYLIIMSILFMLFSGCSGGSNNSNSITASINEPPVAAAGEDQSVAVGETALLSGSGSYDTDENYPLTYEWQTVSVPEGSTATLSEIFGAGGSDSSQISIRPDLSGDYVIQLVVTDSKGLASEPDLVVVSTRNSVPKANAGPDQTAQINDLVTLDGGESSDVDGDSLTYSWSFVMMPDGSSALLSDAASVNPTFTVDVSGTYVAQLMVNDGMVDSAPDTVTINWANSPPVADAGTDQTAQINDLVTLDGGGSFDVDGNFLTYAWTLIMVPDGSGALLSNATSVNPTFTVDVSGTYVAQLMVNDGMVDSTPDIVTINYENSPPVANAGTDQTAQINDLVTLDGGGSFDVDSDSLSFFWALITVPDGSSALLSDAASVNPTFTVDVSGTYVVQLMVNDGMVDSAPDTVTINWANSPPVADAGPDQIAQINDLVTLDGGESFDVDGDSLSFFWALITVPDGSSALLSDAASVNPTFTVDVSGAYVAQLMVNDGMVDSAPDTVIINWANSPPVADAGEDYQVTDSDDNETETVTLDGSASIDPDGTIQAYEWKEGGNVLGNSAIIEHGFSLGTHTVSLTVTDDKGATASDTALVNVLPMGDPDSVTILRAEYTRNTKQLLVEATSTQYPDAALTLEGYGIMTFSGVDSTYIFNSTVGNLKKGATVTVMSSHGGTDTALVNF